MVLSKIIIIIALAVYFGRKGNCWIISRGSKLPRKILRWGWQKSPVLRILWSALSSALPNADLKFEGRIRIKKVQAERPKVRSCCNCIDLPCFFLVKIFSFQIIVFDFKTKFRKEENVFNQECVYEGADSIQDIGWQVLVFSFLTYYNAFGNSLCIY